MDLRLTYYYHQTTVLALCMRLVKEHTTHLNGYEIHVWNNGFFNDVVAALIEARNGERARTEFVEKYVHEYHDIAVYTMNRLAYVPIMLDNHA